MAWLQGSKFDAIIRKKYFKNTPDVIRSGFYRNNDKTSKKVSNVSKNLTLEQKCKKGHEPTRAENPSARAIAQASSAQTHH